MRVVLILTVAGWGRTALPEPPVRPSVESSRQVVSLVNAARASRGLVPLVAEARLAAAAGNQADWMIRAGGMGHLQGDEPARGRCYEEFRGNWAASRWHAINRMVRAGYMPFECVYRPVVVDGQAAAAAVEGIHDLVGENVAYGGIAAPIGRFSAGVIVQGWMDSPGHRKVILNPRFREIGVGYAVTPDAASKEGRAAAWCAVFSTPELRSR